MKDFAASHDPQVQAQLDRLAALSLPQGRIGLEVICELLGRLGNPQFALPPVLHVAGTNGKGSTCAYLRAILEAQGLVVHVATKPHLVRYNERIRVAGELIEDALLAQLLEEALDASTDLGPSFFEVTTAATFLAFSRVPADAVVLEVGLGGRLDATNVIPAPAACGIAALGIDHEAFLLNDDPGAPSPDNPMVRIAFEKAGIARKGAPLVSQCYLPDMNARVGQSAAEAGTIHVLRGRDWFADIGPDGIAYRDEAGELALPLPAMPGAHQADNAALAVAMLRHQQALDVSAEAMASGIRAAQWPARLQRLAPGPVVEAAGRPFVLLDGGHNPDAAQALAQYFAQHADGPVDAIMGMMAAKDARRFLAILAPHLATLVAVPIAGSEHVPTDVLASLAAEVGVPECSTAPDLSGALDAVRGRGGKGPLFIGGSLYLSGKVLAANRQYPD